MSVPKPILENNPGINEWSILHGYRGSIAHGTYIPSDDPNHIDDKDTMSICVPNESYYYGLKEYGSRGTKEIVDGEWDIVVYEARKAIRLLANGNPNVMTLLWLPEDLRIKIEPAGQLLIDNRNAFVGRHVYKAFAGYASSQLSKMTNNKCLGYMGEKRRQLVEKHGYDTKNAAHLIRLLRQGCEFLKDGELNVRRHDAAELVAIRKGEWGLEKIKSEAERLFRRTEDDYDRSTLPIKPNMDEINDLAVEVIGLALKR